MKTISVVLKGISPLLMHAFPLHGAEAMEKKTPQEQAEIVAYRDPETRQLYIPDVSIQRALVSGATYCKGRGRGSLQKVAAASLFVSPARCLLGVSEYIVDSRVVVVPATKGRIIRHRPRLDEWQVSFDLEYDDTLLSAKQVRDIVDSTASRVGLMDFRPEKRGPFGRCVVVRWES